MKNFGLFFLLVISFQAFGQQKEPLHNLYWGNAPSGTKASIEERYLDVRSKQTGAVIQGIQLEKWQVTIEEYMLSGNGELLSEDVKRLILAQRKDSVNVLVELWYRDNKTQTLEHLTGNFLVRTFQKWDNRSFSYSIIDKNKSNYTALFDTLYPMSYISLIAQNQLPFIEGMSENTISRMDERKVSYFRNEAWTNTPVRLYAHQSDRSKMRDSIQIDEKGQVSFAYAAPQTIAYDFRNCDRIVLLLEEDPMHQQKVIKRVALARKFPGEKKYELLVSFDYQAFLQQDDLWSKVEVDAVTTKRLLSTEYPFWKVVKDSSFRDSLRFTSYLVNQFPHRDYSVDNSSLSNNINNHIKFDILNHLYDIQPEELKNYFDSVYYSFGPVSDVPLTDINGDDSIQILNDGTKIMIHPPADIFYYWFESDSLRVRLHYVANLDSLKSDTMYLVDLEVYKSSDIGDLICSNWSISGTKYADLLSITCPTIPLYSIPSFIHYFEDEVRTSRILEVNSQHHKRYLNKHFYLDQFLGIPINLLNVNSN